MSVNDKQVAGSHYKAKIQHWDFVELNELRYIEGCATKYVTRWRGKHNYPDLLRKVVSCFGIELPTPKEDLAKSLHYVEKMIELNSRGLFEPRPGPVLTVTVDDFAEANSLENDEKVIIDLLVNWEDADQLRLATYAIQRLLDSPDQ